MSASQVVDSPIPRVLLRLPRMARRKPGTLGPLLLGRIVTAPLLLICAGLTALVVFEPIIVFLLPAQPARVVGQWRELKGRRGTANYVEYKFDRSGFTGSDEVLPDEFEAIAVGQTVKAHLIHVGPIGYSALDRSFRAYVHYRLIAWLGALFGLAIGGVFFYALWLLPWRAHWLTRHGVATFGAVVEKRIVHSRRRHLHFTLTYQFKAHGTLLARRIRISPQRYDSAGVKDLVIILFDPARPGRSIVYDYCDFVAW
jgi:hypothetical protein